MVSWTESPLAAGADVVAGAAAAALLEVAAAAAEMAKGFEYWKMLESLS